MKTIRKVVLSINRELLTFLIIDRKIYYTDRKLHALIRILPKPKNLLQVIRNSRNRVPMVLTKLFNFTEEEINEYNNAKNDAELADIIVKDGRKNGTLVAANGDMEVEDEVIDNITKVEMVS